MLRLEFDRHEIEEVIDKVVKRTMRMDLIWDWPCGVAYYGIADVYERTGKEEYLKFLRYQKNYSMETIDSYEEDIIEYLIKFYEKSIIPKELYIPEELDEELIYNYFNNKVIIVVLAA